MHACKILNHVKPHFPHFYHHDLHHEEKIYEKWENDGDLEGKLKIDRKKIRWCPPKGDWIIINFDGA